MIAYVILLLAALSRFLPHAMHAVGINFTAVGAGLLFFGSRRPRWQVAIAAAVMAVTDIFLTTAVYGYAFHVRGYVITWVWYAAVALIGSALLKKVSALRVVVGVLASATSFFLLSNFAVWIGSNMYAHSAAGILDCYAKALPFYGNDLVSTGLFAAMFFGVPVVATQMSEAFTTAQAKHQPLA